MMKSKWMINGQWTFATGKVLIIIYLLQFTSQAISQQVFTVLSKDKIVLGEQISLEIKVQGVSPASIKQDFIFPDSVNHLEILSDTFEIADASTIVYTLVLTSFDSGYWKLPSFELLLSDNRSLTTEPLGITVLPVDISNLEDYHDIKDIIEIAPKNNWWIIAGIVALGILCLFGFLWFHQKNTENVIATVSPTHLDERYKKLLADLANYEKTELLELPVISNIFRQISKEVKKFTDAAYQQQTKSLTTGEYILRIQGKLPNREIQDNYFQFLRLADAVKFAKYFPPPGEVQQIFPVLKNIVNQVYRQNKQNPDA